MNLIRLVLGVAMVGVVLTANGRAAERPADGSQETARSEIRRDAISDPLLLLLRLPEIRSEIGLQAGQVDTLEKAIDEVDGPLWRSRDFQFQSAESGKKAWGLISRMEASLPAILDRDQHARLRQLVVQARGPNSLLFADVQEDLGMSSGQVEQVSEILEQTGKELQRLQKQAAEKADAARGQEAKSFVAAQQKKLLAVLADEQKQRWRRLAGESYDLSRFPLRYARAPELRGVTDWINSPPLTLAAQRGKVVALHFFTYGCINCIHNQPAYKDWQKRFSPQEVVVLGIHTPEGEGDRPLETVRKKLQEDGITYPVAVDNDKENWNAWANHTWPAVYLIDKEGYVRYWWYGELNWQGAGGEKRFREKIAELAAE